MSVPIDITDDQFESEVLQSEKPVLIDFWAEWCGPCRMIAPSVKQIAHDMEDELKVVKLNVDDHPAIPGRYAVMGIPTLMLFKNGEMVERITGAMPRESIVATISKHLDKAEAKQQAA